MNNITVFQHVERDKEKWPGFEALPHWLVGRWAGPSPLPTTPPQVCVLLCKGWGRYCQPLRLLWRAVGCQLRKVSFAVNTSGGGDQSHKKGLLGEA